MKNDDFKEEYIDRKIECLEANKKSLAEKSVFRTILALSGTAILGSAAFMISKLIVAPAITLALFDAIIPVLSISADVDRSNQMKQIEREIGQLKSIRDNGVKSTKALDRARLRKVNKLEKEQEDIVEKSEIYSIASAILAIVWVLSTGASIIFPPAIAISIISLLTTAGVLSKGVSNDKKLLELEASINNLRENVELGFLYGYSDSNDSQKQEIKTEKKKKKTTKTISNGKKLEATPIITLENNKIIDEYIESLEQEENLPEKAKEFIKM